MHPISINENTTLHDYARRRTQLSEFCCTISLNTRRIYKPHTTHTQHHDMRVIFAFIPRPPPIRHTIPSLHHTSLTAPGSVAENVFVRTRCENGAMISIASTPPSHPSHPQRQRQLLSVLVRANRHTHTHTNRLVNRPVSVTSETQCNRHATHTHTNTLAYAQNLHIHTFRYVCTYICIHRITVVSHRVTRNPLSHSRGTGCTLRL